MLRYLPTNLSTPEIAGELYLSVNTLRTHMRHVRPVGLVGEERFDDARAAGDPRS